MRVPQYLAEGPVRVARFFVIPFCVSSISSLVMGVNSTALDQAPRGTAPFFLVFPTDPNQLLYCLGAAAAVVIALFTAQTVLACGAPRLLPNSAARCHLINDRGLRTNLPLSLRCRHGASRRGRFTAGRR